MWTMRHMDDYVIVGPQTKVRELTEDVGHTMLLRDVQVLEPGTVRKRMLVGQGLAH